MRPTAGSPSITRTPDASFSGEPPASAPQKPKLPPVQGSLPYSADEYKNLHSTKKSPFLDFMILGKIPEPSKNEETSLPEISLRFQSVVVECLKTGELNALDFLWRESGFDPNDSMIRLVVENLDETTAKCLAEHCQAHPGLKVELSTTEVDHSAVPALVSVIEQGKVSALSLYPMDLSSDEILRLATVIGKVGDSLSLGNITFDIHSEKALAESLLNSVSLKSLLLADCDFGPSRGIQFVEAMQKNQSIETLEFRLTPLHSTLGSSYGAILSKNITLKNFGVLAPNDQSVDVDSILIGALSHPTLSALAVGNNQDRYTIAYPENLVRLLEKNRTLTEIGIDALLPSSVDGKAVAAALSRNTSVTEFVMRSDSFEMEDLQSISDTLARNRALAEGKIQHIAGQAFDPYGRGNGLSDASSTIANYVLANSSSLGEFADTMAAVELSMKDLTAQAMDNGTTTTTASSSSSGTATTTTMDAGSATNATTTTIPSGPASS